MVHGWAQVLREPAAGGAHGEERGQLPALPADAAAAGAGDRQCCAAGEPVRAAVHHDATAAGPAFHRWALSPCAPERSGFGHTDLDEDVSTLFAGSLCTVRFMLPVFAF